MSKYFILNKSEGVSLLENKYNNIISINNGYNYILPHNQLGYYHNNGLYEANLIDWCKQFCKKDKNILDIGAHTGTYSIYLSQFCKNVYAFEPQRSTYYALCGSVALSSIFNIHCSDFGLGSPDQVGLKKLKIISEDGGCSSLLDTNQQMVIREEVVAINTLDYFNFNDISFIKMDVEGNELNVLKGSLETLKRSDYPPILFESNDHNQDLFSFIKSFGGYKITSIIGYSNMFLASTV